MLRAQVKLNEALQRRIDQLEARLEEREAHVAQLADRYYEEHAKFREAAAEVQRLRHLVAESPGRRVHAPPGPRRDVFGGKL